MNEKTNKFTIASWSLYDFANTIFSMNVISLYFALWITIDKRGQDILYSMALSGSMLAVALSIPFFGAISDQTGQRVRPLIFFTCFCCVATASISFFDELYSGLFLFMVSNYCYQSSMVFYNSMLPHVSKGSNVGIISGYGVTLGYGGSIVGLLAVKPFVEEGGRLGAFLPTAGMFLFFSLPCFLFVKDPINPHHRNVNWKYAYITILRTVQNAKQYKFLLKFVCIHFLVLDVVNTIITFMSVYASKVIGLDDSEINSFMIFSTFAAMIGSFGIGWIVKTIGSPKTYWLVLSIWVIVLLTVVTSQNKYSFWIVGPLAGVGMGGVWVVSRSLLVELSPPKKIGEFFGLYGLAGKLSSIIGPMLWGTVVMIFEETQTFKYRAAVSLLLLIILFACAIYRPLFRDISDLPR